MRRVVRIRRAREVQRFHKRGLWVRLEGHGTGEGLWQGVGWESEKFTHQNTRYRVHWHTFLFLATEFPSYLTLVEPVDLRRPG